MHALHRFANIFRYIDRKFVFPINKREITDKKADEILDVPISFEKFVRKNTFILESR